MSKKYNKTAKHDQLMRLNTQFSSLRKNEPEQGKNCVFLSFVFFFDGTYTFKLNLLDFFMNNTTNQYLVPDTYEFSTDKNVFVLLLIKGDTMDEVTCELSTHAMNAKNKPKNSIKTLKVLPEKKFKRLYTVEPRGMLAVDKITCENLGSGTSNTWTQQGGMCLYCSLKLHPVKDDDYDALCVALKHKTQTKSIQFDIVEKVSSSVGIPTINFLKPYEPALACFSCVKAINDLKLQPLKSPYICMHPKQNVFSSMDLLFFKLANAVGLSDVYEIVVVVLRELTPHLLSLNLLVVTSHGTHVKQLIYNPEDREITEILTQSVHGTRLRNPCLDKHDDPRGNTGFLHLHEERRNALLLSLSNREETDGDFALSTSLAPSHRVAWDNCKIIDDMLEPPLYIFSVFSAFPGPDMPDAFLCETTATFYQLCAVYNMQQQKLTSWYYPQKQQQGVHVYDGAKWVEYKRTTKSARTLSTPVAFDDIEFSSSCVVVYMRSELHINAHMTPVLSVYTEYLRESYKTIHAAHVQNNDVQKSVVFQCFLVKVFGSIMYHESILKHDLCFCDFQNIQFVAHLVLSSSNVLYDYSLSDVNDVLRRHNAAYYEFWQVLHSNFAKIVENDIESRRLLRDTFRIVYNHEHKTIYKEKENLMKLTVNTLGVRIDKTEFMLSVDLLLPNYICLKNNRHEDEIEIYHIRCRTLFHAFGWRS